MVQPPGVIHVALLDVAHDVESPFKSLFIDYHCVRAEADDGLDTSSSSNRLDRSIDSLITTGRVFPAHAI